MEINAGWYCRVCGETEVFRADRGGLATDTAYALWQAGNYAHGKGHEVAREIVSQLKGSGGIYG